MGASVFGVAGGNTWLGFPGRVAVRCSVPGSNARLAKNLAVDAGMGQGSKVELVGGVRRRYGLILVVLGRGWSFF